MFVNKSTFAFFALNELFKDNYNMLFYKWNLKQQKEGDNKINNKNKV